MINIKQIPLLVGLGLATIIATACHPAPAHAQQFTPAAKYEPSPAKVEPVKSAYPIHYDVAGLSYWIHCIQGYEWIMRTTTFQQVYVQGARADYPPQPKKCDR